MSPRRTRANACKAAAPACSAVSHRVLGHEVVPRVHALPDLDALAAFPGAVQAAAVGLQAGRVVWVVRAEGRLSVLVTNSADESHSPA